MRFASAVISTLLLAGAAAAEPALCREAHAGVDEPLAALADAEQLRWKQARKAQREARKLVRSTVGMGESSRSLAAAAEVDRLGAEYEALIQQARVLCGCRQERGDPYREDCDRLYRRWLRPEQAAPSAR